ncbi:MAG: hypothetical protein ACFFFH_21525, partial [Candidatus Thorarchaeota archaeon]
MLKINPSIVGLVVQRLSFLEVSSEVVRPVRESFIRFIKIIFEQLPAYIEKYPPLDQLLLKDFLSVLQYFEEADNQRSRLSQRFEEYNTRLLGTDQYLHTPFLWFTESYFSNANLLLNVSKYHADTFYEYLVKHLRNNSNILGVYNLVRDFIPLSDIKWEHLQYSCEKLLVPLTYDQVQIINAVYSFITEEGVYSLDPRKLRAAIVNQVELPKNAKPSIELNRFFALIDGKWFIHFFSPSFGLTRVVFKFQLEETVLLKDIIDFRNPANTVLSASDVYSIKNSHNTYIGILLVPTEDINLLEHLMQKYERQGHIILKELSKITTTQKCVSLNYYQENIGWIEPNLTKLRQLTQVLKSKSPKKGQEEEGYLFITPEFNLDWHYNQHLLPKELIKLYCKIPQDYSYSNLPLGLFDTQNSKNLSRSELGLLKQLYYNFQVVQLGFVPWRLVYDFSLNIYCMILPKIPLTQLKQFLNMIPFSEIYYGENNIYIWARLTSKLVQWIANNLKWDINAIMRKHYPLNFDLKWFDASKLKWKT